MSQIGVSYTPSGGSPVYNFVFSKFIGDELPRSYASSASLEFAVNGTVTMTGPAYKQKRIWAISSPMSNAQAAEFDAMYQAWDTDRGAGLSAAVGVADTTFGPTVTTSAVFTTAPTYSKFGPADKLVSFGLTEV